MHFLRVYDHMLHFLDQCCMIMADASKSVQRYAAAEVGFITRGALCAGLRSESLLRLDGPDDAAASARGYGIRRLVANMMLGLFPCLEDNADCLFPPLAAWQVHDWWLPKAFTTRASVHAFQVCCSLLALRHSLLPLHWYIVMPALLFLQAGITIVSVVALAAS